MTDTDRLIHMTSSAFDRVAQAQVRRQARMDQVVGADGNVLPESLTTTTPLLSRDWWLSGAVTTGTNKGAEYRLPQAGTAVTIHARVKTAPSGGEFQADVLVSGVVIDNVSIAAGDYTGTSAMNVALPAGGVLTVNIIAANSAADATISLYYRPTL
jgi:hypothetical protein